MGMGGFRDRAYRVNQRRKNLEAKPMAKIANGHISCPHCEGTGQIELKGATVGDMILAARKAKKMRQEDLASGVGLSRAQIANIESGRSDVPLKTLARFADALGTTMRDLVPG